MKFLLLLMTLFTFGEQTAHDFTVTAIDGKQVSLSSFKGKKLFIVNTASECGYTYQYENLEKLWQKYKDRMVVIAFPANNFGEQEPGTNAEIANFCMKTYNISFPIMSKVSVKGDDMAPLFKWLTTQSNPDFTGDIKWNFEKFLLDENGKLVHRFRHKVEPLSDEVTKAVESKY
jgi:glutathione peroxidase